MSPIASHLERISEREPGLKSKMQAQFLLGNLAAMFGNQTDDGGFARCAASMEMQVVPAIAKAIKNLLCKHVLGVFGFGLIFGLFPQGTR